MQVHLTQKVGIIRERNREKIRGQLDVTVSTGNHSGKISSSVTIQDEKIGAIHLTREEAGLLSTLLDKAVPIVDAQQKNPVFKEE